VRSVNDAVRVDADIAREDVMRAIVYKQPNQVSVEIVPDPIAARECRRLQFSSS